MGREIRRVPPDWEHPKDKRGDLQPMYNQLFSEAADRWIRACQRWEAGEDPDRARFEADGQRRYFWEWDGNPPNRSYYRERVWAPEEATHFQIYETVSEGTPVSPVCASLDELRDWLIGEGVSPEAAEVFARDSWVPSMAIVGGRVISNYEVAAAVPERKEREGA